MFQKRKWMNEAVYLISDHHCYLYITLKEALRAGSDSFMSGIKKGNKRPIRLKKQLNLRQTRCEQGVNGKCGMHCTLMYGSNSSNMSLK